MINLNFPGPVTSEEGFFDRTREWEMIERAFQAKESVPVIIRGERCIGKTSLQTIAAKRLRESLGFVPLFLPFGDQMHSSNEFAKEIFLGLCAKVDTNPRGISMFTNTGEFRFDGFGEYTQVLRNVMRQASGKVFLVCADEFDATLQECEEEDAKRLAGLVQQVVDEGQRANLPIKFLFSMTTVPNVIEQAFGSSFLNSAVFVDLGPFSDDDTIKMVETLLAPDTKVLDMAKARLINVSGGHPYIVKLILDCLLVLHGHEASDLVVDEAAIKQAVKEAVDDPRARAVFANLYEVHFNDEQKALMLLLAERQESAELLAERQELAEQQVQHQASVTKKELKVMGPDYITAAEVLVRRGYLEKDSEGDRYHLRIPFLGRWLHGWERYESEADKRLKDVPLRLRRLEDPWEGVELSAPKEEDLKRYGLLP